MESISVNANELEILMNYIQITEKNEKKNYDKKPEVKVPGFRKQVEYGEKKRIKP